jgi:hypothetical protein
MKDYKVKLESGKIKSNTVHRTPCGNSNEKRDSNYLKTTKRSSEFHVPESLLPKSKHQVGSEHSAKNQHLINQST